MRSLQSRTSVWPLIVSLVVVTAASAQDQDVQLEIRQRGAPAISVAVPALVAASGAAQHAQRIHAVLLDDLQNSMVFTLVDPRVYPNVAPGEPIPWQAWKSSGARGLIQGSVSVQGTLVVADFRLFDVDTGRQISGKRYSQSTEGLSAPDAEYRVRRIAHTFNDETALNYTGVPGVANSNIAFVSDRDAPLGTPQKEIFLMDYDGERQRRISYNSSISLSPSFSPQSDRIAFQTYVMRDRFPNAEIQIILKTGGRPRSLITCRGTNTGPAFSPDGTLIAYSSSCGGNSELHVIRPDGAGMQQITRNPASDISPAWSPNGRQLVFVSDRSGAQQLYVIDSSGLNTRRLSAPGGQKDDPAWQPVRGELIAFTASTGGNNFDIFVYDLTIDRVHQLTRGRGRKEAPAWSPDGRQLSFEWAQGPSTQIWAMGFDGSRQRILTNAGNNLTPAWGPRP